MITNSERIIYYDGVQRERTTAPGLTVGAVTGIGQRHIFGCQFVSYRTAAAPTFQTHSVALSHSRCAQAIRRKTDFSRSNSLGAERIDGPHDTVGEAWAYIQPERLGECTKVLLYAKPNALWEE
ncbi:hypothetical protein [Alteriqipengyuania lutimaris]|uniref:hypothetical protein n=1 Tax=Alteriqipengyuania lutimaris TaxID=1538146 RepID=UPI0017AEF9AB|nr:hypothetical protein [Alteriqipengyuania lutimaris]MBB3035059.1 hypothetical protein [Alteriqipengyuania lutimaris]